MEKIAMLKKAALLAAVFVMGAAGNAAAYDVPLKPFHDVMQTDWFNNEVYSLSALGIIDGYEDHTYHPDDLLSREAFIKLLVTALPSDDSVSGSRTPSDVEANRWSFSYISEAFGRKWIDFMIDPNGAFHPTQNVTREEVAAAVGKALLGAQSEEVRSRWLSADWKAERDTRGFPDDGQIRAELAPYVYYAEKQGIIEGDEAGMRPHDELPRKEAAAVIYRLVNLGIGQSKLEITGFYAIRSYPAINEMGSLDNVIFGWSHLDYPSKGTAKLETGTTEYQLPDGWEEPLASANRAKLPKELMVFYNNDDLKEFVRDSAARQAFLDSLVQTLDDGRYSYDGVCIDFEGLKEAEYAPDFADFLDKLKSRLGKRTLTVAVPPDYYYKGYDLQKIGAVADSVILMAYDFTSENSVLPSAPLPLVNDTVRRALELVPREKLVLGISKQANQWVSGKLLPDHPLIADVEKRIADPASQITWQMPYFLKEIVYSGENGMNDIFYEDTDSIAKKLWLARYYRLKGVSLWYMGNYTSADWGLIHQEMNK
jgi:hypothetical protein